MSESRLLDPKLAEARRRIHWTNVSTDTKACVGRYGQASKLSLNAGLKSGAWSSAQRAFSRAITVGNHQIDFDSSGQQLPQPIRVERKTTMRTFRRRLLIVVAVHRRHGEVQQYQIGLPFFCCAHCLLAFSG
jgi:hypothetical protein